MQNRNILKQKNIQNIQNIDTTSNIQELNTQKTNIDMSDNGQQSKMKSKSGKDVHVQVETKESTNETPSASFYYDIATPKSPHEDLLLDYEMVEEDPAISESSVRNNSCISEKSAEEKELQFRVSKKDILNNIHLFMLMKYKENSDLKRRQECVTRDVSLIQKFHAKKDIPLLLLHSSTQVQESERTPLADTQHAFPLSEHHYKYGASRTKSLSPLSLEISSDDQKLQKNLKMDVNLSSKTEEPLVELQLNEHHRRNYTNTCPTKNSGVIGKSADGVPVFKRFDGVLIIIKCESCGKEGFTSPQGIVNHARLKHAKLYSTQPLAILNNQKLHTTQSNKVVEKFKELNLSLEKDFLPLVAISLSPITPLDTPEILDTKLSLVSEKSSTPSSFNLLKKDGSIVESKKQEGPSGLKRTGKNASTLENLDLQKNKRISQLNNYLKNIENTQTTGNSAKNSLDYGVLMNDTVDFLHNFKPATAVSKTFADTVPRSSSCLATSSSSSSEPVRKKQRLNLSDKVGGGTPTQQKEKENTVASSFYNLRSRRKRSSVPSKKWDDFVLYH